MEYKGYIDMIHTIIHLKNMRTNSSLTDGYFTFFVFLPELVFPFHFPHNILPNIVYFMPESLLQMTPFYFLELKYVLNCIFKKSPVTVIS